MPELDNQEVESQVQDSNPPPESTQAEDRSEQSLDQHLADEQEDIADVNEANADGDDAEGEDSSEEGEDASEDGEPTEEGDQAKGYAPNLKYKVHGQEFDIDPKFKKVLSKETEPLIRELHEKAHGIDVVKVSRDKAVQERDASTNSYNDLVGRVGTILRHKNSGDLESFFESVQLNDNQIAEYILQKAQIAALPPEQQAVYNERRELRRQALAAQQGATTANQSLIQSRVQARVQDLDTTLNTQETKPLVESFDTRNGSGAFRKAVMDHAAAQWHATKKDLSVKEAIDSFVKLYGITAPVLKPKAGVDVTRRVVAKPKVSTIPNLGRSQASVTNVKKPTSIDEIRKIRKEKYGS